MGWGLVATGDSTGGGVAGRCGEPGGESDGAFGGGVEVGDRSLRGSTSLSPAALWLPAAGASRTPPPPCSLKIALGRVHAYVASTFACKDTCDACESRGRISYSRELRVRPETSDASLSARNSRALGARGGSMGSSSGSLCKCGGMMASSPYDLTTSSCSPRDTCNGNLVASFRSDLRACLIICSSAASAYPPNAIVRRPFAPCGVQHWRLPYCVRTWQVGSRAR
jgi:hypothetical protein